MDGKMAERKLGKREGTKRGKKSEKVDKKEKNERDVFVLTLLFMWCVFGLMSTIYSCFCLPQLQAYYRLKFITLDGVWVVK